MATDAVYEKVFARLSAQATCKGSEADAAKHIGKLIQQRVKRGEISWSTAKQYASAVRWKLRSTGQSTTEFDHIWSETRLLSFRAKGPRKSSRRVQITGDVVIALRRLASFRESPSFEVAANLFFASTLLGLRPCEWANARWADASRTRLIVQNAKVATKVLDHGPFAGRLWVRGNGTERCLKLTQEGIDLGLQDLVDTVIANDKMMPWARHRAAIWRSFKSLVRAATQRGMIAKKYRHLTIYSARHQFAADAKKAMDVSKGEVAAAMGHSAVRTAVTGYGRRVSGGAFAPSAIPSPDSVEAVRSRILRPSRPIPENSPPRPRPS